MTKIGHNEPPKTLDDFLIKDQNENISSLIAIIIQLKIWGVFFCVLLCFLEISHLLNHMMFFL